jgi:glycerol-3-phosphate O-acyltransferase
MSIGYDKVIESSAYVDELLGTPKEKESLMKLISNFQVASLKWGRIDVRFAEPFSLLEYIQKQEKRRGPEFKPETNPEDKNLLLQGLGFKVLSEINAASVVMPTALIGTILLTLRGRGVGRDELIQKVNWLKHEILRKGCKVADFGGIILKLIIRDDYG